MADQQASWLDWFLGKGKEDRKPARANIWTTPMDSGEATQKMQQRQMLPWERRNQIQETLDKDLPPGER